MTADQKKELEEFAFVGIVVAFLLWLLFHNRVVAPAQASAANNSGVATPALDQLGNIVITPPNGFGDNVIVLPSRGDGGCGCDNPIDQCAVSTVVNPTLAKIIAIGQASANQIIDAGNAAQATIIAMNENPLLNIAINQG